jgi:hypothetical protein
VRLREDDIFIDLGAKPRLPLSAPAAEGTKGE